MNSHCSNFFPSLMDNKEDKEEEDEEDLFLLMLAAVASTSTRRTTFYVRDRLEWDFHVTQLDKEGPHSFQSLYRMDRPAFLKLCSLRNPYVHVNLVMSKNRTGKGPITTAIALHCLLRWLGGGSYLDIRLSAGISLTSFYRCVYKCVDAFL